MPYNLYDYSPILTIKDNNEKNNFSSNSFSDHLGFIQ